MNDMTELRLQDSNLNNKEIYNETLKHIMLIFNYNVKLSKEIIKEAINSTHHSSTLYVGEREECVRLYNLCLDSPIMVSIQDI